MRKSKPRFPAYTTLIGEETEVTGNILFVGGMHVDGKVRGDISGRSEEGCALSVGRNGVVAGNLDVAYVVIDGTVIGDVRATARAELASGARIQGTLYYGVLAMSEGAEVNGKLLHVDDVETPRLIYQSGAPEDSGTSAAGSDVREASSEAAQTPQEDAVGSDSAAASESANT